MRDIKYKSLYRGEWYQVKELQLYSDGEIYPSVFEGVNFSPNLEHVKCTVQFTGLKDKNGVDIYEWDVLEIDDLENTKGIVVFDDGGFKLREDNVYFSHLSVWRTNVMTSIIGNIYSNPELINN